jgi:type IV pili sensor histidine kinase/response regulator
MKPILVCIGLIASGLAAGINAAPSSRYDFGYQISQGSGVGIVRAFDDGKNTVIAFGDLATAKPTITTIDGTPISYRNAANYAVLPGIQHDVLVYGSGKVASVHYGDAPVSPKAIASQASTWDAEMKLAVQRQEQLRDLADNKQSIATPITRSTSRPTPSPSPSPKETRGPLAKAIPWAPAATPLSRTAAVITLQKPAAPAWTIKQGETLTQAINDWATKAGYSVVWNADHTFNIEASASFDGNFIKAVTDLFDAYKNADRPVVVDLYPDQKPKPIVVVSNAKKAAK